MTDSTQVRRIALMLDFDNIVLGLSNRSSFQPQAILDRVLESGKIVYKRAYADWSRFEKHKIRLHELGFDLLEIPKRSMTGKNSADIRMVVDAMELVISKEHIDTFCLVTGDSDFTPLVSSLRENDKHVIGIGMRDSSSKLLIESCDEFLYYDELEGVSEKRSKAKQKAKQKLVTSGKVKGRSGDKDKDPKTAEEESRRRAEGLFLVLDGTRALLRDRDTVWASMVKQTLVRKHPSFNESFHGYSSFTDMVRDAIELGILEGERDGSNGNWKLTGIGNTGNELSR
ncbi:MAG TPA: NYN domain-containing protein [Planctomycetes bacterium]|nr:NYN domain-containing protein [Planctomycetota bacterium]|tara:strand:- start:412 stop:1266 length:855 start_codon:yes stop_codon:yes gene_type:complete